MCVKRDLRNGERVLILQHTHHVRTHTHTLMYTHLRAYAHAQVESWSATVEKEEEALARIGEKCKIEQESIETEVAGVREQIAAADGRISELEKGVTLTQVVALGLFCNRNR